MKTVFIMRGISGSGKSTKARTLAPPEAICSADHYFQASGEYVFRWQDLPAAHQACLTKFIRLLYAKAPAVVVDNTNLRLWEYENYVRVAEMAGYTVEYHEFVPPLDNEFQNYVTTCATRNTHGLGYTDCKRQATIFQKRT